MIAIYSICLNRPDLLKTQVDSCRRFVVDQMMMFNVVNNATVDSDRESISAIASDLGVFVKNMPRCGGVCYGSISHSRALNAAIQDAAALQPTVAVVLDHDVFPISKLNVADTMAELGAWVMSPVTGKPHRQFPWPGLMMFDCRRWDRDHLSCLDFTPRPNEGVDTGCLMSVYLADNPQVSWHRMPEQSVVSEPDYGSQFFYNRALGEAPGWIHYGRGSNWDDYPRDYMLKKDQWFTKNMAEVMA